MNNESNLRRARQRIVSGNEAASDSIAAPDGDQLAREVTRAYVDELKRYERPPKYATPGGRRNPADPPTDGEAQSIRDQPPETVSFGDIERLSHIDPAHGEALWRDVKNAARRDLDTGWLAGRSLEFMGGSAWERACFFAIRDRLRRAWNPRNDCEAMLVDEMAQYEMVRQQWLSVLAMRSRDPVTLLRRKREDDDPVDERRMTAHEQTAEAARMVECLQRLYQNAVRTLNGMRRGRPAVIFQRSGQVNLVNGPQLNVQAETNLAAGDDPLTTSTNTVRD